MKVKNCKENKNMVKLINYLIGIHILTGLNLKIYLGLYTEFIPRLIYYTSKTSTRIIR